MAQFTNQARLAYNNSVTNSNIAIGEILEVLSATKTAVRDQYAQNDSVAYIISIVNSGATAFSGLTITDDLGSYAFGTELLYASLAWFVNCAIRDTILISICPPDIQACFII